MENHASDMSGQFIVSPKVTLIFEVQSESDLIFLLQFNLLAHMP